jgi:hypothetical protein
MSPANANVKALLIKIGPVALPRATARPIPPVTPATSLACFCHGVRATVVAVAPVGAIVEAGLGAGGAGRGAVGMISPLCVTMEPRTTSSLKSMPKCLSSGAIERRNFVMLFEYKVDD